MPPPCTSTTSPCPAAAGTRKTAARIAPNVSFSDEFKEERIDFDCTAAAYLTRNHGGEGVRFVVAMIRE
jgi:hypothetical protein